MTLSTQTKALHMYPSPWSSNKPFCEKFTVLVPPQARSLLFSVDLLLPRLPTMEVFRIGS